MLLIYVITISTLFIFESKTSLLLANSPFDLNIGVPVQMTFSLYYKKYKTSFRADIELYKHSWKLGKLEIM